MKYSIKVGVTVSLSLLILLGSLYYLTIGYPVNCRWLVDDRLSRAPFPEAKVSAIREWITSNYWLANMTKTLDSQQNVQIFSWSSVFGRYHGQITDRLNSISQQNLFPETTLEDVIRCNGVPVGYSWWTQFQADTYRTEFLVWYPSQGYAFSTGVFYSTQLPVIHINEVMPLVFVVTPDTVEKMANDVFVSNIVGNSATEFVLQHFVEWPEDFEEIQLSR